MSKLCSNLGILLTMLLPMMTVFTEEEWESSMLQQWEHQLLFFDAMAMFASTFPDHNEVKMKHCEALDELIEMWWHPVLARPQVFNRKMYQQYTSMLYSYLTAVVVDHAHVRITRSKMRKYHRRASVLKLIKFDADGSVLKKNSFYWNVVWFDEMWSGRVVANPTPTTGKWFGILSRRAGGPFGYSEAERENGLPVAYESDTNGGLPVAYNFPVCRSGVWVLPRVIIPIGSNREERWNFALPRARDFPLRFPIINNPELPGPQLRVPAYNPSLIQRASLQRNTDTLAPIREVGVDWYDYSQRLAPVLNMHRREERARRSSHADEIPGPLRDVFDPAVCLPVLASTDTNMDFLENEIARVVEALNLHACNEYCMKYSERRQGNRTPVVI